ncbi:MAG: WecB/TagA/CpsF family glycosyltransferase [Kineosporiaceae bacterium]
MSGSALAPPPAPPVLRCARIPITACTREEAAHLVVALASGSDRGGPGDPGGSGHPGGSGRAGDSRSADGSRGAGDSRRAGVDVHLCNAYTLALADRDPVLRDLLVTAAVNFPDGKSVVWANQLLHRGREVPGNRVYGPDLFLDVLDTGQDAGLRHYLLGGSPEVLAELRAQIARRFPRAEVVGAESPPFRERDAAELAAQDARIRASGAQLVWVGLGTPKQDREVARLAATVPGVHLAVGAAFDFVAGAKRQAPGWLQEHGLEWVFRLVSEPRRLWRRYLFGNTRFLWAVARNARR